MPREYDNIPRQGPTGEQEEIGPDIKPRKVGSSSTPVEEQHAEETTLNRIILKDTS